MNKYQYLFLIIALAACNNESKTPAGAEAPKSAGPQAASEKSSSTGDCSKLALFRKGTVLEAVTYDAAGKESAKQTTTVTDVSSENGFTIARASAATSSSLGEKIIAMNYKCDGKNLYMDLKSFMQDVAKMKGAKVDVQELSFPIQMTEGEILPEASFTMGINGGGKAMNVKATYKNRTVGPKEKVTTPAGTWDCYKVNTDIESEIEGLDAETKKIMDAVKQKTKMQMIMWLAPDFGMVKMEMLINGKRNSYTEVTSVKQL